MSPSQVRRKGREAFDPQTDPHDINPYVERSFSCNFDDWMDGWAEAAKDYEAEQSKEHGIEDDWEVKSLECPWKYADTCNAVSGVCSHKNCAPWYFSRG